MNLPQTKETIERQKKTQIMQDMDEKEFVLHAVEMIYGFHHLNRDRAAAQYGEVFHRAFNNIPDNPMEFRVYGILQGGSIYIAIAQNTTALRDLTLNRVVYNVLTGMCEVFGGWSATFFRVHLIREERIGAWYDEAMDMIKWIRL